MDKLNLFKAELDFMQTDEVKKFLETAIEMLPDYFFTVPASSSGKYHPQYALGEGGLVRHTRAACKFCMYILNLEQTKQEFSDKQRDLILASVLLHDGWKHGKDNKNTVFEHPLVAADWVRNNERFLLYLHKEDLDFVGDCIASHMGEWHTNKRSTFVLEKPKTEAQKLVHMCDYLASRKDIEVLFEDTVKTIPVISRGNNLKDFVIPFGKHRGDTLEFVYEIDQSYLTWAINNISDGKVKENMVKFINEKKAGN